MAASDLIEGLGPILKDWRDRRRLSQLALALDSGISARHLSFIETNRSKPGRDVLLAITERLEVPLRERNQLLLAAGYAPAVPELSLEDSGMKPLREALNVILTAHEPNPALVVDRNWNLVAANAPIMLLGELIDPSLMEPPINVMRAGLHPNGLAPWIVNLAETRTYFLGRLERQVEMTGDSALATLLEEVAAYPSPEPADDSTNQWDPDGILTPQIRIHLPDGRELACFATFLTFGTAAEVTASELSIELAFPADSLTADFLRSVMNSNLGASLVQRMKETRPEISRR